MAKDKNLLYDLPLFPLLHGKREYKLIWGLLILPLDFTVQQQNPFPFWQEQSLQPSSHRGDEEPGFTACSSNATGTTRYAGHHCCRYWHHVAPWTLDATGATNVVHCLPPTLADLSAISTSLWLFMSLALAFDPGLAEPCSCTHVLTTTLGKQVSILWGSLARGRLCCLWRFKRWGVPRHERVLDKDTTSWEMLCIFWGWKTWRVGGKTLWKLDLEQEELWKSN